ncbi:uncharacterized protein J3D65DRAFT_271758 [Phyllosticta citribraziliensis]|uniref:Uncharacterized protein n=1 Tax=Phyllosticta citribraziliensis TaxID=989973 RepID=A0ABR1M1B8_9PEZI
MFLRLALVACLLALADARTGQEQIPIAAIRAINGARRGQADAIADRAVSDLTTNANSCDKLRRADQIMAQLGTGADSLKAAIGMVAAEKNFNNNRGSGLPALCGEPALPQTPQLRGITPLIDPEVLNAQVANQLSAKTEAAPIDARGMSIADLMVANGFTQFVRESLDGTTTSSQNQNPAPASNNPNVNPNAANPNAGANGAGAGTNNPNAGGAGVAGAGAGSSNNGNTGATASGGGGSSGIGGASGSGSISDPLVISPQFSGQGQTAQAASNGVNLQASSISGVDFGKCLPTMKFEGGLDGRSANEGAFQAIDPQIAAGQQSSRDPKDITARVCAQVSSAACGANDAAQGACESARAQIAAQNDNDKSTVDAWNTALGFAGTKTNPSGGRENPRSRRRLRSRRFDAS